MRQPQQGDAAGRAAMQQVAAPPPAPALGSVTEESQRPHGAAAARTCPPAGLPRRRPPAQQPPRRPRAECRCALVPARCRCTRPAVPRLCCRAGGRPACLCAGVQPACIRLPWPRRRQQRPRLQSQQPRRRARPGAVHAPGCPMLPPPAALQYPPLGPLARLWVRRRLCQRRGHYQRWTHGAPAGGSPVWPAPPATVAAPLRIPPGPAAGARTCWDCVAAGAPSSDAPARAPFRAN